ncbi:MAG: stress response translation initiation inhibitor YciH [Candidatus Micrarchaeia archaeon]
MNKTSEICPVCGYPKELCVCEAIEKESVQKIKVYVTKKKFGKLVTVVEGIDKKAVEDVGKELKRKMACGGTMKEGVVFLQGDHRAKVKQTLIALGYPAENISVI